MFIELYIRAVNKAWRVAERNQKDKRGCERERKRKVGEIKRKEL